MTTLQEANGNVIGLAGTFTDGLKHDQIRDFLNELQVRTEKDANKCTAIIAADKEYDESKTQLIRDAKRNRLPFLNERWLRDMMNEKRWIAPQSSHLHAGQDSTYGSAPPPGDEEEARKKAEEEARKKAEEEATKKAEEEATKKAAEEATKKAAEEATKKAEEEARKKAEEETRKKAEEESRKKAEEEARKKAREAKQKNHKEELEKEAEILRQKEKEAEEARQKEKGAEEARQKAEEARKKAEEEARQKNKEAEEARQKAEEARQKGDEEARKKADEEASNKEIEAVEARSNAEKAREKEKETEEARQKAEEEARQKSKEAANHKAYVEARRKYIEQDEEEQLKAEEEAVKKAEEEVKNAQLRFEEISQGAAKYAKQRAAMNRKNWLGDTDYEYIIDVHPEDRYLPEERQRKNYPLEIIASVRHFLWLSDPKTEFPEHKIAGNSKFNLRASWLLPKKDAGLKGQAYIDNNGHTLTALSEKKLNGMKMEDFDWWGTATHEGKLCYNMGYLDGKPAVWSRSVQKKVWKKIDHEINDIRMIFGQLSLSDEKERSARADEPSKIIENLRERERYLTPGRDD